MIYFTGTCNKKKPIMASAEIIDESDDDLIDDELFLRLDKFFNSQMQAQPHHPEFDKVSESEPQSLAVTEKLEDAFQSPSELQSEHQSSTPDIDELVITFQLLFLSKTPELVTELQPVPTSELHDDAEIGFQSQSEASELASERQSETTNELLDDAEMAFQLQLAELAASAAAEAQQTAVCDLDTGGCYAALLELEDDSDYVPNYEPFDCPICFVNCDTIQGVRLRNCHHTYCKECIANVIKHSDDAEIKCPFVIENQKCDSLMTDREIRALLSDDHYEKHLEKSLLVAERSGNTFHCRTPNCKGFCFLEEDDNEFICSMCDAENCFICKVRIVYISELI